MKTKTVGLVIGMVVWCALTAAVAYSADDQVNVNGKVITCTVSDIKTDNAGVWKDFNLRYDFCKSGNNVTLSCNVDPKVGFYGMVICDATSRNPLIQDCDGVRFTFNRDSDNKSFRLGWATVNAQHYVCSEQFKLMKVTVEPLK